MSIDYRAEYPRIKKMKLQLEEAGQNIGKWVIIGEEYGVSKDQIRSGYRRADADLRKGKWSLEGSTTDTEVQSVTSSPVEPQAHSVTPVFTTSESKYGIKTVYRSRYNVNSPVWQIPEFGNIQAQGKSAILVGDIHAPHHSPKMMDHALDIGIACKVDYFGFMGDLAQNDQFQGASRRAGLYIPSQEETDEALCSIVGAVTDNLPDAEQLYLPGNHDDWIQRHMGTDFSFKKYVYSFLGGMFDADRMKIFELDYLALQFTHTKWIVGHLEKFKNQPGKEAANVKASRFFGCNVAGWHEHQQGFMTAGKNICLSVGAMLETREVDGLPYNVSALFYKERRMNSYRPVENGFLLLRDGEVTLFGENGPHEMHGGGSFGEWIDNYAY